MTKSVNTVFLLGHVGTDPEVRATASGSRVAKISLATNNSYRDKSGKDVERTDWHRVTCFGKLADVVENYVHKGDRLHVRGRIQYSQTEDKGITRYWTDIVVDELTLLGGAGVQHAGPRAPADADDDSDLPY